MNLPIGSDKIKCVQFFSHIKDEQIEGIEKSAVVIHRLPNCWFGVTHIESIIEVAARSRAMNLLLHTPCRSSRAGNFDLQPETA
jgi:hypothetical protein